jgi:hypothetical protein
MQQSCLESEFSEIYNVLLFFMLLVLVTNAERSFSKLIIKNYTRNLTGQTWLNDLAIPGIKHKKQSE